MKVLNAGKMMETTHDYGHSFCLRDVRGVGDRDQWMTQEVPEVGQWVEARETRNKICRDCKPYHLVFIARIGYDGPLIYFRYINVIHERHQAVLEFISPHIHPLNLSPHIIFKIETSTF